MGKGFAVVGSLGALGFLLVVGAGMPSLGLPLDSLPVLIALLLARWLAFAWERKPRGELGFPLNDAAVLEKEWVSGKKELTCAKTPTQSRKNKRGGRAQVELI